MNWTLKILGKPYKVRPFPKGADYPLMGLTNSTKQEIEYKEEQALEQMQDTQLHEVLHAVDYAVQTKLSERQVATIATALLSVFKDNPKWVLWLLKGK